MKSKRKASVKCTFVRTQEGARDVLVNFRILYQINGQPAKILNLRTVTQPYLANSLVVWDSKWVSLLKFNRDLIYMKLFYFIYFFFYII